MPLPTTFWLALAMALIAAVNVGLMAWLWRFPMVPDPTGRDPNGVSTAPRSWTNVHRVLGYVFTLAYVALLVEMVPRAWEHQEATGWGVAHGALGALVGVLLAVKILVIRRFRRFGHRLPWIGGALAVATWLVVALAVGPLWTVLQPSTPLSADLAEGRALLATRCLQCHGASVIAGEDEDADGWDDVTEEMQDNAAERPGATPITESERRRITAYLVHTRAEADDADRAEDGRDGRGRGRGRSRD